MTDTGSPLAGLTGEQADEAIDKLADKIKSQRESVKVAEAHLKDMRAARKDLLEPEEVAAQSGTSAGADAAEADGRVG